MNATDNERFTSPAELLRKVPARIRYALSERALRKEIAQTTEQIEQLHDDSIAAEVTRLPELTIAMKNVHQIAELTQTEHEPVAEEAKAALDDSAEHIFKDLEEASSTAGNKLSLGINPVLDALNAWDVARTEATHNLATIALKHFHGLAQDNLREAFKASQESSSPFNDELTAAYERNRAA